MLRLLREHMTETVSMIIVATALAIASLVLKEAAMSWPRAVLVAIGYLLLTVLVLLVLRLSAAMTELRAVAPRLTYYDVYGKHGRKLVFEEAQKIVRGAEKAILALNWSAEEHAEPGQEANARDDYFEELLAKCEHVSYRRVLQADAYWQRTNAPTIGDTFDRGYVEHFRAMLDAKQRHIQEGQSEIDLVVVPPSVPSTFIIVDDKFLVWQLIERRDEDGMPSSQWRVRGAVVVHDPQGDFISHFKKTFERVQQQHRPVTRNDLNYTPGRSRIPAA
jgi:hypothetical protein